MTLKNRFIRVEINDTELKLFKLDDLATLLISPPKIAQIYLETEDPQGPSLLIFVQDNKAVVLFMRQPGDVGYTLRNKEKLSSKKTITFQLYVGQIDEYPESMVVPFEQAFEAAMWFFDKKSLYPLVTWFDDEKEKIFEINETVENKHKYKLSSYKNY